MSTAFAVGVVLDRPGFSYYAGETLTGRVYLRVDKPTTIKSVKIDFSGEAMVRRQRRFILTADLILNLVKPRERKEYLSSKSYLLGGDSGEEKLLGPGDHEFHFQCALPHRLPSSFAGKYGHIRYTAKASVRRAEGGVQRASVVFTVVEPLDLNTLPQATVAAPIDKKDSKHFWCLGCSSGPLSMSLRAPRGGYVPGQTIPFDVEVCNEAGTHAVQSVSVKLIQLVYWTANCQRLFSVDVLDKVVFDDSRVEGNESKAFSREFTVRPVPPALSKDKCDLLSWKYILQAKAKVGGPHINLRVSTPIVIGTTPLAALK